MKRKKVVCFYRYRKKVAAILSASVPDSQISKQPAIFPRYI
jgi:hypothetical protein